MHLFFATTVTACSNSVATVAKFRGCSRIKAAWSENCALRTTQITKPHLQASKKPLCSKGPAKSWQWCWYSKELSFVKFSLKTKAANWMQLFPPKEKDLKSIPPSTFFWILTVSESKSLRDNKKKLVKNKILLWERKFSIISYKIDKSRTSVHYSSQKLSLNGKQMQQTKLGFISITGSFWGSWLLS